MVSWVGDGYLGGMTRERTGDNLQGPYLATWGATAFRFASAGSVDANVPTRIGYGIRHPMFNYTNNFGYGNGPEGGFYAAGEFMLTQSDINTTGARWCVATMFVAEARDFTPGSIPLPSQILNAPSVEVFRSDPAYARRTPGPLFFNIFSKSAAAWNLNDKYWILVAPCSVEIRSSTPSVARDRPLGNINTNGRALSAWTARDTAAPIITSPATGSLVAAGSLIDFTFDPQDPDELFNNGPGPSELWVWHAMDLAGVQVQFSPRPTASNPNPPWNDLPIATTNTSNPQPQRGWYADFAAPAIANDGARVLRDMQAMKIRCGSNTITPGAGILPAGEWRIRMRTFKYGHPYPNVGEWYTPATNRWEPKMGWGAIRSAGPETYRASEGGPYFPSADLNPRWLDSALGTSPWSTPINISVTTQIPPPIPLNPVNSAAVVSKTPTLTWQYRNTASPPFAQRSRTVQIRPVGSMDWFTIVSGNSSIRSYPLPASYVLEPNVQYEWRVQVTDTSNSVSSYSEPAQFWHIPSPNSGAVTPVPTDTIDGASLGCGQYRAFIYLRGGRDRIAEITGLVSVDWARERDEMSQAKIEIADWSVDCGALLARLRTWAYELVLYRDNGFSVSRVWEGPLTLIRYEKDKVTLQARDVMAYAYRRIVKQAMNDNRFGDSVVSRATRVLQNALAPDDPNVLGYLNPIVSASDPKQYRAMPAYSRTAYEEVDDMASNAGLDYTVVGRAILLWGTRSRIGTLPEFRDENLGSVPIVTEYGMNMANRYVVSDGNGIWGEATRGLDLNGADKTFGLVEMLSSTWATEAEGDTGTYTQENVAKIQQSFKDFAERSIADRYPPPVLVRVPDNTTLNPNTLLDIQHLVPGVAVPLRSVGTLRPTVLTQKLDSVRVNAIEGEERISISMSPFNRDDADPGGGDE